MYRRRGIRMKTGDILAGLRRRPASLLPRDDLAAAARSSMPGSRAFATLRRLPGDHKGNPIIRFFWKGAGLGDDTVV